jgi:hypothetical protein
MFGFCVLSPCKTETVLRNVPARFVLCTQEKFSCVSRMQWKESMRTPSDEVSVSAVPWVIVLQSW